MDVKASITGGSTELNLKNMSLDLSFGTVFKGKDGKDGANGKSAFQYAIDGGFTGTEQDFYNILANRGNGSADGTEVSLTKPSSLLTIERKESAFSLTVNDAPTEPVSTNQRALTSLEYSWKPARVGDYIVKYSEWSESGETIDICNLHGMLLRKIPYEWDWGRGRMVGIFPISDTECIISQNFILNIETDEFIRIADFYTGSSSNDSDSMITDHINGDIYMTLGSNYSPEHGFIQDNVGLNKFNKITRKWELIIPDVRGDEVGYSILAWDGMILYEKWEHVNDKWTTKLIKRDREGNETHLEHFSSQARNLYVKHSGTSPQGIYFLNIEKFAEDAPLSIDMFDFLFIPHREENDTEIAYSFRYDLNSIKTNDADASFVFYKYIYNNTTGDITEEFISVFNRQAGSTVWTETLLPFNHDGEHYTLDGQRINNIPLVNSPHPKMYDGQIFYTTPVVIGTTHHQNDWGNWVSYKYKTGVFLFNNGKFVFDSLLLGTSSEALGSDWAVNIAITEYIDTPDTLFAIDQFYTGLLFVVGMQDFNPVYGMRNGEWVPISEDHKADIQWLKNEVKMLRYEIERMTGESD